MTSIINNHYYCYCFQYNYYCYGITVAIVIIITINYYCHYYSDYYCYNNESLCRLAPNYY